MFFADPNTAGVPDIIVSLFPNLPNFIAHVLATIVLVVIIAKLVYKPFRKAIRDRRDQVDELLSEAILKQTEANLKVRKIEQMLENAKSESSMIIQTSKIDADVQKNFIIAEAHKQAEIVKLQADKDIEQQKAQMELEIKNTIIDVAFSAAEKILHQEISKSKNKQLVDDFIKELDK